MRIAVLSMTRDRLAYTKHCFRTLVETAGCDFDWYVLDNGSEDGTQEWLLRETDATVIPLFENIGNCRALNRMLAETCDPAAYEAIVRWDNDCECIVPNTLKILSELAVAYQTILAPRVLGLRNPPPKVGTFALGDYTVDETEILGGIFMAIPATFFSRDGFRYDESFPVWAGDEAICSWHRNRGGRCGYVQGFAVNHYRTTDGQHADMPWYFERRVLEGGPV